MVYSNYPRPASETLPTLYDLPSEELDDGEDPDGEGVAHPRPAAETLPTMYDLPSEDPKEPGLPDEFHDFQPKLLRETCKPPTYAPTEIFSGADLNLYYDVRQPRWYKRPDWFLVLGVAKATQQSDLRWSYVVWQEGVNPFLVVELLSPGTEADDLGETLRQGNQPPSKWQVYEQILRVPYYGIFDRYTHTFRLFQLTGSRYEAVDLAEPRFWFEDLALGLGVWQGDYQGTAGSWLRWYQQDGNWVPTLEEQAQQERLRAEAAQELVEQTQRRAEAAQERAERLAAQLRALGIEPE